MPDLICRDGGWTISSILKSYLFPAYVPSLYGDNTREEMLVRLYRHLQSLLGLGRIFVGY